MICPSDNDDERKGLPSASNWRRYELCHGSYQLEQEACRLGQEAHKASAEARSGERIHAFLAGESVELSQEEMTNAQFLEERIQDQVKRIFGDAQVLEIKEKRFWLHGR